MNTTERIILTDELFYGCLGYAKFSSRMWKGQAVACYVRMTLQGPQ
jgi:hypothetical protein